MCIRDRSSPVQTVTVSYTGAGSASGLVLTATPPFSLTQNTCAVAPATLASGKTCTTGVVFSPSLNGPYTGTLTDVYKRQASPSSLTFAAQAGGTSSNPQAVTVTNTGTAYLAPTFNATSGDFTMNGSMAGGCQSNSVAPGGSCTINVSFSPTQAGTRSGALSIGCLLYTSRCV